MPLQDGIKTMMLDFINKKSKIFKIVLLATINSIIVITSLLLKKTRYSYKKYHNFEEYCV